ncbi:MAG: hypothetical protein JRN34_00910 [Nitrososphaerota archaeon]|nr:hypothetical protein [Nitrososphaerota archaeon]
MKKRHSKQGKVLLSMGAIASLLLLLPITTITAQSANSNLIIQGDDPLFNYTFDFCHYIGLGSCNVGVSLDEAYTEQVQLTTTVDHTVLEPGTTATLTADANPQQGSATIRFTFTLGSKSYSASTSISTPGVGAATLGSFSIPLSVILAPLGISSILPIPGDFATSFVYNSILYDAVSSNDFTGGGQLQWASAGSVVQSLSFDGTHPTSTLGLGSMADSQDWQLSFDLTNLPLVNQVHLYSQTITSEQFGSNSPTPVTFYHVIVEQPSEGSIATTYGSAWYISGYQLSLSATPTNSYTFQSWSANGQTVSTSPTYAFTVAGPTDVTANFAKLSAVAGVQGIIQSATDFLGSVQGIVFLLVVIAIIAGVAVRLSRKSP